LKGLVTIPTINENVDPSTYDFSKHDVLIFLDTGNLNHISPIGDFVKPSGITLVDIDHHAGNTGYGDFNCVKAYGSACTVLFELIKAWQFTIDIETLNAILIGIMLDTGFYQYCTVRRLLSLALAVSLENQYQFI